MTLNFGILGILAFLFLVTFSGNLQLLPDVLLLGGPWYLHALAHRIVVKVVSPWGRAIAALCQDGVSWLTRVIPEILNSI